MPRATIHHERMAAAAQGDASELERLLRHPAPCRFVEGLHPAHMAAQGGHVACLAQLSPDVHDRAGRTPLHYAVHGHHVEAVRLLVEMMARPDSPSRTGQTPLALALTGDSPDIVKALLPVSAPPGLGLHEAVRWQLRADGGAELLSLLVARGADVDETDWAGDTALHLAMRWGVRADCLAATLPSSNAAGRTPAHEAVCSGSVDLLPPRYPVATPSYTCRGEHPLHDAARRDDLASVRELLRRGARVNARSASGETPLRLARDACASRPVQQLLQRHGARD